MGINYTKTLHNILQFTELSFLQYMINTHWHSTHYPPNKWHLSTKLHRITSQRIVILTVNTIRPTVHMPSISLRVIK